MAAFDLSQKGPTMMVFFLVFVVFWLDGVKRRLLYFLPAQMTTERESPVSFEIRS